MNYGLNSLYLYSNYRFVVKEYIREADCVIINILAYVDYSHRLVQIIISDRKRDRFIQNINLELDIIEDFGNIFTVGSKQGNAFQCGLLSEVLGHILFFYRISNKYYVYLPFQSLINLVLRSILEKDKFFDNTSLFYFTLP